MIFVSSKISDGNMSIYCGDPIQATQNKDNFFKGIKINPNNVVELKQVHGNKIIKVNKIPTKIVAADGLITNNPKIYLMVRAADCHQIGIYDPTHQTIALIHTGYKGLEKRIIKKAVANLKKIYGSNPKDLSVQFGPSIGPCHYRIDLWKEAEDQLISLGTLKENIENPKICTYENKDYFSHRRAVDQNTADFRFATILGLSHVN